MHPVFDPTTVRADFDKLAPLIGKTWDHNAHYHRFLLRHAPSRCENVLEIGCGSGTFARSLAARSEHVLALDLSPRMLEIARSLSTDYPNIDYRLADIMTTPLPPHHFDCIASIATLHHLPMPTILPILKDSLKPGGVLLILDLYQAEHLTDLLRSSLAVPLNILLELAHNHRLRPPRHVRDAWREHGKNDVFPVLSQVRQLCRDLLPGARVQQHLLWRYSLIWQKSMEH